MNINWINLIIPVLFFAKLIEWAESYSCRFPDVFFPALSRYLTKAQLIS